GHVGFLITTATAFAALLLTTAITPLAALLAQGKFAASRGRATAGRRPHKVFEDKPIARAGHTFFGETLAEALALAVTGHFHQSQVRELADLGLGLVGGQFHFEGFENRELI